jgi:2-polyprenyl-3-methyl-5-hydroxy-6-metoxy-1,4-benzoquinol methylase
VKTELNWREVWERKRGERVERTDKRKIKTEDFDRVARDYSEWNRASDYEYGRKAVEAVREIISPDFEVLDIGAGPGTLAIPLAEKVRKVTVVEPSKEMIKYLMKDAEEEGVKNIEVIDKNWQEVSDSDISRGFDIVACSHLLWQFKDVDEQLKRMEAASRKYCCVVHPAGSRDTIIKHLWTEIIGREYRGELDPDLDDLLFVMLRQRGILVNVKVIDYTARISVEQEEGHIESLLERYTEITPTQRKNIGKCLLEKARDGIYERKSNAAVVWWQTLS